MTEERLLDESSVDGCLAMKTELEPFALRVSAIGRKGRTLVPTRFDVLKILKSELLQDNTLTCDREV